jgi:membrane fusion protein, multidrug efflux system
MAPLCWGGSGPWGGMLLTSTVPGQKRHNPRQGDVKEPTVSFRKGLGWWFLLIVAAGVGVWAWRSTGRVASSPPPVSAPVVTVSTVKPTRSDFPIVLEATGNVAALSSVDLRSQTTSTVKAVHVKEGDFVRAGQLLFTLDDRADRANVDKARAQLARDQAALADARRQVQRSRELVGQGFLSQSAVDTTAVLADQASLRAAEVALSYNTVRAPIDGRIGAIGAYPGTLVLANATATPMLTVTRMNPVSVNFTLPEGMLQPVRLRRAQGPVVVEALAAGAQTAVRGTLSFIDSTVDAAVGGVRAKAQFDNTELLLWPGQSATVRVTVDVLPAAWQVPLAALITSPSGLIVYVVDKDSAAQPRKIKLLGQAGTLAAVEGLAGEDTVVLDGKQNLRAGSKVRQAGAAPTSP